MRNSKRNNFIKSLTSIIVVVLMLALMLTGCTDKEAQSLANTAQGVADKAQTSADEANKNATSAYDKAESNLAQLTELEKLVMSLPDSEAVATAIATAIADYVKGDGALAKDSIVTYEEVKEILAKYVAEDAYLEATEFIIKNDAKFDEILAEYEAKKGDYDKDTYDALVKNVNENRIRFRRALVADCGNQHSGDHCCAAKILETVTPASAK